ncbi:cupin domain-containing protein [Nocardia gipuzkoensis]|uniref:cupin domain-containing protein n=1 Tax=Nocardia gipuzkoensis TaxID=2749991 RepID=UPI00237E3EBD|nr:cupin domain-containing protein [Nocardia gipuzkoensis]MDE1675306.1 cupin domain-containing protein [Nocardia gipuzkoensis]
MTFYDRWLGIWDDVERERAAARQVIHAEELEWVETVQDAKAALGVARETGFRTWGSETMFGEIPVGWHTGEHSHGEESMYILDGEGFSVVDGRAYRWQQGSTLAIPFGARHQHFNTGSVPARYLSALTVALEEFVGLHRTRQYESCGKTTRLPDATTQADGRDPSGRRIVLPFEEAEIVGADSPDAVEVDTDSGPMVLGTTEAMQKYQPVHHLRTHNFMSIVREGFNDFQIGENEISSQLVDAPRSHGGRHAHMEAILYVISGEGYTEMDGENVPWRAGSTYHISGPQVPHQHFNTGREPSTLLRIAGGIRYFFERVAKEEYPYLYFAPRGLLPDEGEESAGG